MTYFVGLDVGSTYAKAAVLTAEGELAATAMRQTGFRLEEATREALNEALGQVGATLDDVAYVASTGYGRNQIPFRDVQATDLTAQSWGTRFFFPNTMTVLDVGGQTMKALRLDEEGQVRSFRLNDKCAAGTGAFLEKTARYLGYSIQEIGPLVEYAKAPVPIARLK